ncbi:hypothetical protein PRZ02_00585 [Thermoproteati archaeon 3817-70]
MSLPGRGISGVLAALLMISLMSATALAFALSFNTASRSVSRYEESDHLVQLKESQRLSVNEDDYPVINVSGYGYLAWALAPAEIGKPHLVRLNVSLRGTTTINLTRVFGYTPSSALVVTSLGNVCSVTGSEPEFSSNTTSAAPGSSVELLVKKGDHPFYELFWNGIKVAFGSADRNFVVSMPNVPGSVEAMIIWYSGQWEREGMAQLLIWCKSLPHQAQSFQSPSQEASQTPGANAEPNTNSENYAGGMGIVPSRGNFNRNSENLPNNSSTGQISKPSQTNDWPRWIVVLGVPPNSRATIVVGGLTLKLQADQAAVDPDPEAPIYPEPLIARRVEYAPVKVQEGNTALISYAPESYYVQITSTNGGSAEPLSGWYPTKSSITLRASPERGYRFVAWVGSAYCGIYQTRVLVINGPLAEKAIFAPVKLAGRINPKRPPEKRPPRPEERACKEAQGRPKRFPLESFFSPHLSVPS